MSFQNTPTFDFNPNNAKQFWLGVTNPISPDLFGYFLQRGIDPNLLLNLLISRIDEFNYDAARKDYVLTHERYWAINENVRENELVAQIRRWTPDNGQKPVVVRNSTSQPLGVPVAAAKLDAKDALSLAATAQSAGLELRANKKFATIQLYKTAEKDVLCVWDGGHYSAISFIENSSVKGPGSLKPSSDDLACSNLAATDKAENVHGVRYAIQLRSVEGIFYYLGSLLKSDHPPLQAVP